MKDLIRLLAFINEQLFRPKHNYEQEEEEEEDDDEDDQLEVAATFQVYQQREDAAVVVAGDGDEHRNHCNTATKVPNQQQQSCLLSKIDSSSLPELRPGQAGTTNSGNCTSEPAASTSTTCVHSLSNCSCDSTRNLYHSVSFVPKNQPSEQISLWSNKSTRSELGASTSSLSRLYNSLSLSASSGVAASSDCLATKSRGIDTHRSGRRRWQKQQQQQNQQSAHSEINITNQFATATCSTERRATNNRLGRHKQQQHLSLSSLRSHQDIEEELEITNRLRQAEKTKTKTIRDPKTSLGIDKNNRSTEAITSLNRRNKSAIEPVESETIESVGAKELTNPRQQREHNTVRGSCSLSEGKPSESNLLNFGRGEEEESEDDDDWILLSHDDDQQLNHHPHHLASQQQQRQKRWQQKQQHSSSATNISQTSRGLSLLEEIRKLLTTTTTIREQLKQHQLKLKQQQQLNRSRMALENTEIELIRASWISARTDPVGAGVLLFKGLFTKFPDYLKFFTQFSDLDIERIRENKRLLKHAVKVIDTVTFVVDSIGGDETKTTQLNEALVNLVRGHLKRKIGLTEFRNLGIVIIDFICDLNSRRGRTTNDGQLKIDNSINSNSSSIGSQEQTSLIDELVEHTPQQQQQPFARSNNGDNNSDANYSSSGTSSSDPTIVKLDTNLLVAAWTKLYSSILDLVKRLEEEEAVSSGVANATLTSDSVASAAADSTTTTTR